MAHLVHVDQYHLVRRGQVDFMALVVDEPGDRVDHNVSRQVAVVADVRSDRKLLPDLALREICKLLEQDSQ